MSQVRVNTIVDANSGNTAQINGMTPTADSLQGFRNRIINGNMVIDQRNAGAATTPSLSNTYNLDRWYLGFTQSSKFTVQQNAGGVTPPSGFKNYLGCTTAAAYSVGASDFFFLQQNIEGFNVADFGWGAAGAQSVTLSFWVRSSLTGTFNVNFANDYARGYAATYTINAANTWEQKTITIPGDTTGTWGSTNGVGVRVLFNLGSGSSTLQPVGSWGSWVGPGASGAVSVVGTSGATFYITGVQLEAGSVATAFERRPYGAELALCQRYCINYRSAEANGPYYRYAYGECVVSTYLGLDIFFPVPMRVTPSLTTTGTAGNYCVYSRAAVTALSVVPTLGGDGASPYIGNINGTVGGGLTQGSAGALMSNNNNTSFLLFSAEL